MPIGWIYPNGHTLFPLLSCAKTIKEINMVRFVDESVAEWLIAFGTHIVRHGLGNRWSPQDASNDFDDGPGLIDEINPERAELYAWVGDLLRFVKSVVAILDLQALPDEIQMIDTE